MLNHDCISHQRTIYDTNIFADTQIFANENVDLILGGYIYPHIMCRGLRKNALDSLLAQESVFGWFQATPKKISVMLKQEGKCNPQIIKRYPAARKFDLFDR
ncbi:unnamed protein product, partial [Ceratitis capitata]